MTTYKVIKDNGTTRWYNEKGYLHREDGPAVECDNGSKAWYLNGQFHREDGPAIEYSGGAKAWYLNNKEYTEAEWLKKTKSCNDTIITVNGKTYKLVPQ